MEIFVIYFNTILVKSLVKFYAFFFKYTYTAKGNHYKQLIFFANMTS